MEELFEKFKEEVCEAIKTMAEPIFSRLEQIEHLVNDVIIASALEVDRDDRYAANKEKWGPRLEGLPIDALEGPDYDAIAVFTDSGIDDSGIEAMITAWADKIAKIKGIPEEVKEEVKEEVAEAISEVVEKVEEKTEPEPAPVTTPVIDDSEIKGFAQGGRMRPAQAKTAAGTAGPHADSSRGQPNSRGKTNPGLSL